VLFQNVAFFFLTTTTTASQFSEISDVSSSGYVILDVLFKQYYHGWKHWK